MHEDPTKKDSTTQQENQSLSDALTQAGSTRMAGKLTIEIKASFELDDARVFDLNGKGLTIAAVTSN